MNTNDLKSAMLEVLDNPTQKRVIIETLIPSLNNGLDNLYYMIDRGDCGSEVLNEPAIIYDEWHITNSAGEGITAETNQQVIDIFGGFPESVIKRVYTEYF